ncbi:glycerol kinase, glycosomal [Angomonas deanei]|uniref:glycerol kinase n=1 Tax=Angomonas deanei TaxID=59799 RepID=S9WTC9_9TRYP|nr:glycerol kinase [Angomonas deanei]EPY41011.1 glycerol kinase, glycosomal [Angomonas deanei]EPY42701.1 glycerol kinase, glycosomal [Angomonas deanei]CAD2216724.1 FGGY family of carbohydrate kinases, N-terminal domain/FGGY family of carbohydrate kinases, C-terminal domain containing protein, putative [Angomonas deanei]|eukprot:EPY39285.1 glycerol kinase [Angomonas deanei]
MSFVAAIDQGTSSTRCMIFDHDLNVVSWHQLRHRQITPKPGWSEHDPEELFKNAAMCFLHALEGAKKNCPSFTAVKCVGITNQRETAVAWDRRDGKPLYNAIVWSDVRTEEIAREYASKYQGGDVKKVSRISGLLPSAYFTAFKFRWMLDNVPEVKEARERNYLMLGTVDSWLLYKFSGGKSHLTDVSNASRTFLMDLNTRQWSPELCEQFDIPIKALPDIRSNSEFLCNIETRQHSLLNALEHKPVPITGSIGDQQAALVGNICLSPGQSKATYGSGCFILINVGETPKYSSHGLLSTVAYQLGSSPCVYAVEGAIGGAGLALDWMMKNLKMFSSLNSVDSICYSVPDSDGVVFVPAFGGLMAPYWQPDSRGSIFGLTYRSSRGNILRALFESIAQQVSDVIGAYTEEFNTRIGDLKVDGGLSKNRCMMEMQADALGVNVLVPHMLETTSLGAALCAGLAGGVWTSLEEMQQCVKKNVHREVVKPTPRTEEHKQARLKIWRDAVAKSRKAKL